MRYYTHSMWAADTEEASCPSNGANVANKHLRKEDDSGETTQDSWVPIVTIMHR